MLGKLEALEFEDEEHEENRSLGWEPADFRTPGYSVYLGAFLDRVGVPRIPRIPSAQTTVLLNSPVVNLQHHAMKDTHTVV